MATHRVVSYEVTLRTFGIFTSALIELDVSDLDFSVLIQYDVEDTQGNGLYAVLSPATGLVLCHAVRSDYERHLDLLRNESPVFFKVGPPAAPQAEPSPEGVNIWSLATSEEPPGEGPSDADAKPLPQHWVAFLGHEFGFVDDHHPT